MFGVILRAHSIITAWGDSVKQANTILSGFGTTVFEVMSRLAIEHRAINLGQGFPDEDGPLDVREAAARALTEQPNQYPPMMGLPELRQAVADIGPQEPRRFERVIDDLRRLHVAQQHLCLRKPGSNGVTVGAVRSDDVRGFLLHGRIDEGLPIVHACAPL